MNPYIEKRLGLLADELQAFGDRNDLAMAGVIHAAIAAYCSREAEAFLELCIPYCAQVIANADEKRAAETRGS